MKVAAARPERRHSKPELKLSLQFADATHKPLLPRHRLARWVRAALEAPAELTLRIVGADEARALNRVYRGRDYATDVLTFDYQRQPYIVADLVLAAPVVARDARAQRRDLVSHYALLVVHGVLHAQGYDHERVRDERVMRARESAILQALGLPDPWA